MAIPAHPASGSEYRPEIHLLRSLAVTLVVLFHIRCPGFAGGFVGVDVFFVLSGFLITGSLLEELQKSHQVDFARFYARRIRRLLPASTLMLVTTLLAGWLLLPPLARATLARSAASSSVYLSNLHFAWSKLDYLAGDSHLDPFLHTWSLSVEEQFYLAWPVLIWLAWSLAKRFRPARSVHFVLGATVLVIVISFAASMLVMERAQPWAFFSSPTRAWEFGLGALARILEPRFRWRAVLARLAFGLGIAMIGASALTYSEKTPFPGLAALLPVLGTTLAVASGSALDSWRRIISIPQVKWLGEVSYSWYLWHWPFLVIPHLAWGEQPLGIRFLLGGGSLAAAWATLHTVENPVRFHKGLARSTANSILAGAILSASAGGAALLIHFGAKMILRGPEQSRMWNARSDLPSVYRDQCHLDFRGTSQSTCAYGDTLGDSTIMLIGDSHAASWHPVLDSASRRRGLRLVSLTKSACPPNLFVPWAPVFGRAYDECREWHDHLLARLESEQPFLVVVGTALSYKSDSAGTLDTNAWDDGWRHLMDTLQASGARVVVLQDVPRSNKDIPTCLSEAAWTGEPDTVCDFPLEDSPAALRARLANLKGGSVDVYDLTPSLCPNGVCSSSVGGVPVYSDGHHLSTAFSRSLIKEVESRILTSR